jgi:hypothetical protein
VYFTGNAATFYRTSSTPTGSPQAAQQILASGIAAPPFLVDPDDVYVYAVGDQSVVRFRKDGTGSPTVLATMSDVTYVVAQDKASIYFTTAGKLQNQGPPYAAVWRLAK